MKIIFLDIDGVLNSAEYRRQLGLQYFSQIIDLRKMPLLKKIVEETGAEIVLSSSWREFWNKGTTQLDPAGTYSERVFLEYGLTILDKTPEKENAGRSAEIQVWLKQHPYWDGYVILDDKDFGWPASLRAHFIRTDINDDGLEEYQVQEVIDVLNGKILPVPENKYGFLAWLKKLRNAR